MMSHDGVTVGVLDFGSEVSVPGTSITDVLVTATFSTSKWDALSLTEAYYAGTLTLTVDAQATVTVEGIGYTREVEWHNYILHLDGEYGDRELCACEKW